MPDQPTRAVRTRMLRGVGGGSCEAPPYPDKPKISRMKIKQAKSYEFDLDQIASPEKMILK